MQYPTEPPPPYTPYVRPSAPPVLVPAPQPVVVQLPGAQLLGEYFSLVCNGLSPYLNEESCTGEFLNIGTAMGNLAVFTAPGRPTVRLQMKLFLDSRKEIRSHNVVVTLLWEKNGRVQKIQKWKNETPSGTVIRIIGNLLLVWAFMVSDPIVS